MATIGVREWTDAGQERDLDLAVGLIRHRDPSRAATIEQGAQRAGQAA